MVGCILNKHPKLYLSFEQSLFYSLYREWRSRVEEGEDPRSTFLAVFSESRGVRRTVSRVSLSWEEIETRVAQVEDTWGSMLNAYMCALMKYAKETAERWGDKTPHHVGSMERIASTYSQAHFIYVYRDPRHTIASLSDVSFPHASNSRLINAEVVRYYHNIFERQKEKIEDQSIFQLRYERLLKQPEKTLARLCNFLSVDYTPKLTEPAPREVRETVGWENCKGWEKIKQQSSRKKIYKNGILADSYINSLCDKLGYSSESDSYIYKIFSTIMITPFVAFRRCVEYARSWKYPFTDNMFMNKFPDKVTFLSWLDLGYRVSSGSK